MCRLFGMNAGDHEAHVSYWLLDASDSILAESHRNPDGTGIGWFGPDGVPHIKKQPKSAFDDPQFRREATSVRANKRRTTRIIWLYRDGRLSFQGPTTAQCIW